MALGVTLIETKDSAALQAGWALLRIAHLCQIEARLRDCKAVPRLRQARRAAQSRPVIARLHKALLKLRARSRHLPKGAMGRATDYAPTLWSMLKVYVEDGRIEIDNNRAENAIRPTAVSKKNCLFIGEAEAGQRSAIL